ncbi:hypothetical protein MKX03_010801 [Papaver bracteatum]|nr:hypothetical protein MKX03_010801 [Papaver bracteatum]
MILSYRMKDLWKISKDNPSNLSIARSVIFKSLLQACDSVLGHVQDIGLHQHQRRKFTKHNPLYDISVISNGYIVEMKMKTIPTPGVVVGFPTLHPCQESMKIKS